MDIGYVLGLIASLLVVVPAAWYALKRARRAPKDGLSWVGRFIGRHMAPAVTQAATVHLRQMVTEELQPVVAALSPNSGSSVADKVTRLDQWREDFTLAMATDLRSIKRHLDRQDRAFQRHLEAHAEHKAA